FWDTIQYDKKAGIYRCQLDEQWFVLTKDTLREALQITPLNNTQAFVAPPSAERIWEEFNQSIHTFIEDKRNLSRHTTGKKRATLILIPSIRFTKLIIHHLQRRHMFYPRPDSPLHLSNEEPVLGYLKFSAKGTKREVFRMPILGRLITADIQKASYYQEYQENVAKHRGFLTGNTGSTQDLPAPKPAKPSRKPSISIPVADEDADYQKAMEESMKVAYALPKGPLPPVVIMEPVSGKYQPLLEVPGKGKAKVTEEQVSHDLLSLKKHKKISSADQYTFQRRVSEPTESSFYDESPYDVLGQSDSEEESEKTGLDVGAQAVGQAGSNPDETSKGQAGSNPDETSEGQARPDLGDAKARVQSISSPMVHAGSDREHMDLDVADVSPQPSMEQLDEGFTATVYPNVQENLKHSIDEPVLLEEPASSSRTLSSLQHLSRDFSFGDQFFSDKHLDAVKNAVTEVESMEHQQLKATTTDTTTTITTTMLPPPQAPQQSTTEAMMVKCISELEHIMADLIQANKNIDVRLDKHGARLYTLEQLDIPQQVSIGVSEVVTDAVDWAMQAHLCNRFRDLPEADMKEILYQRMWESDSYKSHEVHMQLFEALEKSMNRDHSEELAQDLAEARKKNKKGRESPKTPPGSPSHQPPPSPPPAGPSGASVAPRASRSQVTPPPPLPTSTSQDNLDMDEAMGPDEQAQLSDDEDFGSAHISTVNLRQDWWKPFKEERPTTLEPAWSIRSSDVPTSDIATFMDWFCKRRGITKLKPQDLEGPAYEIVKVFHLDVIHLQYQMEECHKLLTDGVDDPILRHNISKPLPLGGPPEYLRYGSKGCRPALSISKMKATYYPNAGIKQMVPDQFWIKEECKYDIAAMYGISYWWFQRQRFYIDRHTSEGHLNHLPPKDKKILTTAVNQWTRQLVIRQHVEDFQLGIESYQTQVNLTKLQWMAMGFEYKHDYTVIESPRAVIFQDKYGDQQVESRFKYEVLDQEGRRSVQRVHVRDSEAFEDTEDLPQPRELCWLTRQRGRL
nr:histone deacetylase 14 [Tanacetum cinerariifolium]